MRGGGCSKAFRAAGGESTCNPVDSKHTAITAHPGNRTKIVERQSVSG